MDINQIIDKEYLLKEKSENLTRIQMTDNIPLMLKQFSTANELRLPIFENDKCLGSISVCDLANAIFDDRKSEKDLRFNTTIRLKHTLTKLTNLLIKISEANTANSRQEHLQKSKTVIEEAIKNLNL